MKSAAFFTWRSPGPCKRLTISHCAARKKYGQLLPCHPSPFLRELPREFVEFSDEKSKTPVSVNAGKNLFAAMRAATEGN